MILASGYWSSAKEGASYEAQKSLELINDIYPLLQSLQRAQAVEWPVPQVRVL